jgi:hypothetical protein
MLTCRFYIELIFFIDPIHIQLSNLHRQIWYNYDFTLKFPKTCHFIFSLTLSVHYNHLRLILNSSFFCASHILHLYRHVLFVYFPNIFCPSHAFLIPTDSNRQHTGRGISIFCLNYQDVLLTLFLPCLFPSFHSSLKNMSEYLNQKVRQCRQYFYTLQ